VPSITSHSRGNGFETQQRADGFRITRKTGYAITKYQKNRVI